MNDPAPPTLPDPDTVPALARAIAGWFPELANRSIAVTENEITKDNIPTLPLAMTALVNESARQSARTNADPTIIERIIVEFWFPPERYRRADGSESPFWAYYSLDKLRSRLLGQLAIWRTPRGQRLTYTDGDITADQFAVTITLQFAHEYELCLATYEPAPQVCTIDGLALDIGPIDLLLPDPNYPPPEPDPDPCPPVPPAPV